MIDVIIVNWNSGNQLCRCIDSLVTYGLAHIKTVIVVDNGSTDGSEASVEDMEDVRLIRVGRNLGYAKACNLGAAQSDAEYLLFLNPDTRIFPDSLSAPLDFMQESRSARIGIIGVRNVGDDGSTHRHCCRFPTPGSFIVHGLGLSALWPRLFPGHFMTEWCHDEDRQVDHVIGSYFLVKREVWNRLGGMDERFFVYLEDLDFSFRAHQQNWKTWYLSHAKIYHKGGGTSQQVKADRLFYSLRSRLLYAAKHFGWAGLAAVFLITLLVEPFTRIGWAVVRGEWATIDETIRGYVSLYRALPAIASRSKD
jgi:GT2 family glycosyltransferase